MKQTRVDIAKQLIQVTPPMSTWECGSAEKKVVPTLRRIGEKTGANSMVNRFSLP